MNKAENIFTFATWHVSPGRLEVVLKMLADLRVRSLAEPGNLVYEAHKSTSDKNILVLLEGYKDEAALAEHRSSEHYRELVIEGIIPLLKEREITVTTRL